MPVRTSSATAVSLQARSATGRYAYRANAPRPQAPDHGKHAELAHALGVHRQLLTHAASAIRTLTAARNELIAQAIEDGLTVATVSAVTGENLRTVRTIALAYDDLHPSGLPRQAQLSVLQAKSDELRAAESHRDLITERREALIVGALKNRVCDDLELASMTGLTQDHIRRASRGVARPA
jgi:DNA-binding transcriptional regulator YdaS (Cro superfamily)